MPELHELSVAEAAAQIREGTLSPVALAESLLARIDAWTATCRPGSPSTATRCCRLPSNGRRRSSGAIRSA